MRNLVATCALAAAAWGAVPGAWAQAAGAIPYKIELHPGQRAEVCIGPVTRQADVQSELATVACDKEWSVFSFIGLSSVGGGTPAPLGLFVHEKTGLCIASPSDAAPAGARLVLDNCASRDAQRWLWDGRLAVQAKSGLCLGTASGRAALNTPLVLGACGAHEGQQLSQSSTIAPRTLAAAVVPGAVVRAAGDDRTYLVTPGGQKQLVASPGALQGCGRNVGEVREVLPGQLDALPTAAPLGDAGACLAQRHAGRVLVAGFHVFYVNHQGHKQKLDSALIQPCGFERRDLVTVDPEVMQAIPTGDPMPADAKACADIRTRKPAW